MNWYDIENIDEVDSPSLVLYESRMDANIQKMISMVNGKVENLMPHVKTNKTPEVIKRMVDAGIVNFKASTISEAEIAAEQGAKEVMIAHQLVGPKINRLVKLVLAYPETTISTIIDNPESLTKLDSAAASQNISLDFYIDINNGMDRSGIKLGKGLNTLLAQIPDCKNLVFKGLHVYDGHLHQKSFEERNNKVEAGFIEVEKLFAKLETEFPDIKLVSGGTPSFTSHLKKKHRIASPGTCVFWDWGYEENIEEQSFDAAALLVTRVISKPTEGIVTIDLGHKSVAAENTIDKRVKLINLTDYELLSQSEEHGVLKVKNWDSIKVGDVFYGIPYHICPTVNLHDELSVIKNNRKIDTWQITARRRKINI
ncbi:D-TA family PLP-dependent enzyme [Arcticibacterium luteifluviistationis]|uniref:Alanine racemase n=1 Tax=Arcticibacterium luteifluviistationis TaxID=1784714 RepID=A0A2Z4GI89_9BACT|nr:D-TA family PLP-dependent enzyme [Arcticibacterium luteifluviistationis]AWW00719.1 alanine racemase [Arcticibacterium luteifluviistationis]